MTTPPPSATQLPAPGRWYHPLAYLLGGLFLANFVPHFVMGVAGSPFQSPFATPPGEGLSSSSANVLWGLMNLAVGYGLLGRVGQFDHRRWAHLVPAAVGFAAAAFFTAHHFGRFHGGLLGG